MSEAVVPASAAGSGSGMTLSADDLEFERSLVLPGFPVAFRRATMWGEYRGRGWVVSRREGIWPGAVDGRCARVAGYAGSSSASVLAARVDR
jgi:hypothetical protein